MPRQVECRVAGCTTMHAPGLLMCRAHWFSVPLKDRRAHMEVFRTYQAAQTSSDQMERIAAARALRESMDRLAAIAGGVQ